MPRSTLSPRPRPPLHNATVSSPPQRSPRPASGARATPLRLLADRSASPAQQLPRGAMAGPQPRPARAASAQGDAAAAPSRRQLQRLRRMGPDLRALGDVALGQLARAGEALLLQGSPADEAALLQAARLWRDAEPDCAPSPVPAPLGDEMSAADAYAVAMAVAADFAFETDADGAPYALSPMPSDVDDDASGASDVDDGGGAFDSALGELAPAHVPRASDDTVMRETNHSITRAAVDALLAVTSLPAQAQAFAPLIRRALQQHEATTAAQALRPQPSAQARAKAQQRAREATLALRAFAGAQAEGDEMGPFAAGERLTFLAPRNLSALSFAAHIWCAIHSPQVGPTAAARAGLRTFFVQALADCIEVSTNAWGAEVSARCCPWGYVQRLLRVVSGYMGVNTFTGLTPSELLNNISVAELPKHRLPSEAELAGFYALAVERAGMAWDDPHAEAKRQEFHRDLCAVLEEEFSWRPPS